MRILRRKIWSRFWGLAALVALTSFAAALAWAAYDPSISRGVRALGSFLERVPERQAPRKAPAKPAPSTVRVPLPVPVAPVEIMPRVAPPPSPETAAPALPALAPQAAVEDEAWDEEDELHSDEDEMPTAPSEEP